MSNFSCNLISKDLLELEKIYSYDEYDTIKRAPLKEAIAS